VVFDADGVLIDTESAWAAARRALFERHGRRFGRVEDRQALGGGVAGTGRMLSELLDRPNCTHQLSEELLALLLDQAQRDPPRPLPGAIGLLGELRGQLPIAVASNSPRVLLAQNLDAAGLGGLPDLILGGDEVGYPKPAPDLYLTASKRLGVKPSESLAIEDSPAGVAAARAAGLYVIGIETRPDVTLHAHQVADSLNDPALRARLGIAEETKR